ncbi:MAG TPA: DUF3857 domain-containing protein [Pyrinomonadaceae bacterium]|jgi:hypothetical protein
MKFPSLAASVSLTLCCLFLALVSTRALAAPGDNDWKPVDPAELALKASTVEKDADAEALFWEVRIDDNPEGDLIFNHYLRIKIFTERGRESESKVDILFGKIFRNNIKIKEIAGRTIKPDGTIVELKKEDIYERNVVRTSGLRAKAKSFAMPGVEPGSIIEYRWREIMVDTSANYLRLEFQRNIPVQRVTYFIKPFPFEGYGMMSRTFHSTADVKPVKEKGGFYSITMTNMPAFHEEPRMPPEDEVRVWTLLYYTRETKPDPAKYWGEIGKALYDVIKPYMKVNDEVKQAAATAIGDAATPEQKLKRLFEFCRTKIKNISDDASGLTAEERAKLKSNKSPSETLKRGMGTGENIDLLFAALATAAGFDARVVMAPDRGDIFFSPNSNLSYFLNPAHIAVRVGEQWRFYNPGYRYIPEGMLIWNEEGTQALITDPKAPVFVETPLSGPEKSVERRTAKLKLSEDGTLEGDVRIEYTGHLAVEKKEENDEESAAAREQALSEMVRRQLSTAEISAIKIENVTEADKPFVYAYHVRVPGYAQRTGKRLFLQPAFFEHGIGPLFQTSERKQPIYFHYPWSEEDAVTIDLPEGFALDNPEAPSSFSGGQISAYNVKMMITKDNRTLIYNRKFFFGGGGNILFPVTSYGQLKTYFDQVNKQDNHTITLKQSTEKAAN